ncbi:hypothetical protein [Paucibacter sp. PLA-PC-4]|uniref:hypothetical protein n=1 Tax=Paucibacter sp. PLA-PC-4 TaxID=2993655 RepID=UPI003A4C6DE1
MQALGTQVIAALSPTHFDALSPAQLGALSPQHTAAISTQDMHQFSDSDLLALRSEQITAFSAAQLRALDIDQLNAMSTQQIEALSGRQVQALHDNQIHGLAPQQFAALSPADIGVLSTAQAAAMSDAQLRSLSAQAIAALSEEARRALLQLQGLSRIAAPSENWPDLGGVGLGPLDTLPTLPKFEPIQTPSRPELAIELDFDIALPPTPPASMALVLPSLDVAPVLALPSRPHLSELLTPAQDVLLGAAEAEPTRGPGQDSPAVELSAAMLQELQRMTQEALFDGRSQLLI